MGSATTSCQGVVHLCTGHEPSWVSFDPSGHSQGLGGYVELGPNETHGQLQITLQSGRRFIAGAAIAMQQLWQVSCVAPHTHTVYANAEVADAVNCNGTSHCAAPVYVDYVSTSHLTYRLSAADF